MSEYGCYLIADRQVAKQLFGNPDGTAVLEVIRDLRLLAVDEVSRELSLPTKSKELHDLVILEKENDYPANHIVLGGRTLHTEGDGVILLKRPDTVQHIAAALEGFCAGNDNDSAFLRDVKVLDWQVEVQEWSNGTFKAPNPFYVPESRSGEKRRRVERGMESDSDDSE